MNEKPTSPGDGEQTGASGSRWEPAAESAAPVPPPPAPAAYPVAAPTAAVPSAAASAWGALGARGKAAVAGVAAALLLGGGVAGFGIGHATGDDRDGELLVGFNGQVSSDTRDGSRGFGGQGDQGGQFGGPGQFPGPMGGQLPDGSTRQQVPSGSDGSQPS